VATKDSNYKEQLQRTTIKDNYKRQLQRTVATQRTWQLQIQRRYSN